MIREHEENRTTWLSVAWKHKRVGQKLISRGEWKQNKGDKKITGDNRIGGKIRVGMSSE